MDPFALLHQFIVLPFKQAYRLQKRVQHVVKNTAESASTTLSQRAFEKQVRDEQMALDHLEEHGQCCVCHQQGAQVPGRRKHDGGMRILEGQDAAILSAALGMSVRGYLCPTCDVIRTKLKARLQAKQAERARDQRDGSGGGGGSSSSSGGASSSSAVLRGGRLNGVDGASLAAAHEEFLAGNAGLGRSGMAAGPLSEGLFRGVTAWPTNKPLDIGIIAAPQYNRFDEEDEAAAAADPNSPFASASPLMLGGVKIGPSDSVALKFRAKDLQVFVPEYGGASPMSPTSPESPSSTMWTNINLREEDYRAFFRLRRLLPEHGQSELVFESEILNHESPRHRHRRHRHQRHHHHHHHLRTPSSSPASASASPAAAASTSTSTSTSAATHYQEQDQLKNLRWSKTQPIPVPKLIGRDCAGTFLLEVFTLELRDEDIVSDQEEEDQKTTKPSAVAAADNNGDDDAPASPSSTRPTLEPQFVGRCSFRMDDLTLGTRRETAPVELIGPAGELAGLMFLSQVVVHRYIANEGSTNDDDDKNSADSDPCLVPAWAVAALHDRLCDYCKARPVELFHKRYRELLCGICRAARRHPRDCVPISSRMPDRPTALSLAMSVVDRWPNTRADPRYRQPLSLFPSTKVDLFLQQTSSSNVDGGCHFSAADGLLAEELGDGRRLRAETLFAGRALPAKVEQSCSSSSSDKKRNVDLFSEYWKAEENPSKLLEKQDLLRVDGEEEEQYPQQQHADGPGLVDHRDNSLASGGGFGDDDDDDGKDETRAGGEEPYTFSSISSLSAMSSGAGTPPQNSSKSMRSGSVEPN